MANIDAKKLVPLYKEEEAAFRTKERWQRRFIAWFGLATGLSFTYKFALVYYDFISARAAVSGPIDSEYLDLEFNALLGVIVGVCLAIAPVIVAFWMGKRKPEAFAAKKFADSGFQRWLLGIATVYLSIIILILGIGLFVTNIFLGWAIGFEGAHLIIMFGSMLLSAPLFVEGLWVLSAYKRGIEHVCVLRKGKWSHE